MRAKNQTAARSGWPMRVEQQFSSDHISNHPFDGSFGCWILRGERSVSQDDNAVCQFQDLIESVGDIENGNPAFPHSVQVEDETCNLRFGQARARFVENYKFCFL